MEHDEEKLQHLRSAEELLTLFGQVYQGRLNPSEVLADGAEAAKFCEVVRVRWNITPTSDEIIRVALGQAWIAIEESGEIRGV